MENKSIRIVDLLKDATNIRLDTSETDKDNTTIFYDSECSKATVCIHKIFGSWKIKSIEGNKVTLEKNEITISKDMSLSEFKGFQNKKP